MCKKNLAVLFDVENVSYKDVPYIIDYIEKNIGVITLKNAYGDWQNPNINNWKQMIQVHAIQPKQYFSATKKKNSTDIGLAMDAIEIICDKRKKYDAFCLISSDSDFSGVAQRIRQKNIPCYGFGEKKTSSEARQSYTQFIEINSLRPSLNNEISADKIREVISVIKATANDDGWVSIGLVGSHLNNKNISYGGKLSAFLRKINTIEVMRDENNNYFCRIKENANQNKKKEQSTSSTKQNPAKPQPETDKKPAPISNSEIEKKIRSVINANAPENKQGWVSLELIVTEVQQSFATVSSEEIQQIITNLRGIQKTTNQKGKIFYRRIPFISLIPKLTQLAKKLENKDGWIKINDITIIHLYSIDYGRYGFQNFHQFLRAVDCVELNEKENTFFINEELA